MKTNRIVFLTFTNSNVATAYINVPFKVSRIHTKQSSYNPQNQPAAGAAQYLVLSSDLVNNEPMAILYNDNTYSYAVSGDIEYKVIAPMNVAGNYTFYLRNRSGSAYTPTGGGTDYCQVIIEFNDENEI